jgi:PKD repeat protein
MRSFNVVFFSLFLFVAVSLLVTCKEPVDPEIDNNPPTCTILSPELDVRYERGSTVFLEFVAEDRDNNLENIIVAMGSRPVDTLPPDATKYELNTTPFNAGEYNLIATAIDKMNEQAADTVRIIITEEEVPPVADFYADDLDVLIEDEVHFVDVSQNNPSSWNWDFGDGSTSTERNPVHTYTEHGQYSVKLTVANEFGSNEKTRYNYINVKLAEGIPVADFSSDVQECQIGEMVHFTDQSDPEPTEWMWDFGDGNTSTEQNPTHSYEDYGRYDVSLVARNALGVDTLFVQEYIHVIHQSGIAVVTVEGGTYVMGCTSEQENCHEDEFPIHSVTVNDFLIGTYEVTCGQFVDFLNEFGVESDGTYNGQPFIDLSYTYVDYINGSFFVQDYYQSVAVEGISWFAAKAFCEYHGGRLPTEAEWEYAARGGRYETPTLYAGSNNYEDVGVVSDYYSDIKVTFVGTKLPNELGIYDMSGNATELCSDYYDENYYATSPQDNPQGPEAGTQKVLRGLKKTNLTNAPHLTRRWGVSPSTAALGVRIVFEN